MLPTKSAEEAALQMSYVYRLICSSTSWLFYKISSHIHQEISFNKINVNHNKKIKHKNSLSDDSCFAFIYLKCHKSLKKKLYWQCLPRLIFSGLAKCLLCATTNPCVFFLVYTLFRAEVFILTCIFSLFFCFFSFTHTKWLKAKVSLVCHMTHFTPMY